MFSALIPLYINNTEKEVLNIRDQKHFNKYLLLDKSMDNIVGVVSVKDIILLIGSNRRFDLRSIVQAFAFYS